MTLLNLVYVHIGGELPECFMDNIYQTLLMNYSQLKIYILLDDDLVDKVKDDIGLLNNIYFNDNIPLELHFVFVKNSLLKSHLDSNISYKKYIESVEKFQLSGFRNGFWITTTMRFFYIWALMELFNIKRVFHIENDVILYDSLSNIYNNLLNNVRGNIDKMIMVKDSEHRVIPSIMYIPDNHNIAQLVDYISVTLQGSDVFLNDMMLLASYPDYYEFNIFPSQNHKYLFDGAAIGQYIDGTDIRNLPNLPPVNSREYQMIKYTNPTKGFINETCIYKPNITTFYKRLYNINNVKIPLNIMMATTQTTQSMNIVANAHVHSKQLYKFSSVFDMNINDIISGDKVVGLCDFVIATHEIINFHKNIDEFISVDKIILIRNFNNINYKTLNNIFIKSGKKCIKLFIYTHLLDVLIDIDFFNHLNKDLEYVLYFHNSDHSLNKKHQNIASDNYPHIKKIYTQNPEIDSPKVNLLPIGLANSMWPHGDTIEFYNAMKSNYMYKKSNGIYININTNTFGYRKTILDKLRNNNWKLSASKPYKDYLNELSSHYFCLCIRGNGIDTHRFWESLYLGVIPVIINNEETDCTVFVNLLNKLGLPFYEIKSLDVFRNTTENELFNDKMYRKIIYRLNSSIQNLKQLKLEYYDNMNV
jgi:hypothetical protein